MSTLVRIQDLPRKSPGQTRYRTGAGACLGAVRNTAAFTFWLEKVQVSALPSPVRDRLTGRPGRIRGESSGSSHPAREASEGSLKGAAAVLGCRLVPVRSRAAASGLLPKPANRLLLTVTIWLTPCLCTSRRL